MRWRNADEVARVGVGAGSEQHLDERAARVVAADEDRRGGALQRRRAGDLAGADVGPPRDEERSDGNVAVADAAVEGRVARDVAQVDAGPRVAEDLRDLEVAPPARLVEGCAPQRGLVHI